MLSTVATYRMITRDLDRSLAQTSAEKPIALETAYYLKNIGNVKTIDDLLKDTRLFKYAMKAFGLEDMDNAKALMRKVVTEGVTDPQSFANRLSDDRFVQFATAFSFSTDGEATTAKTAATQGVADLYVRQTLENEAGADNEGVRLALYFQREAPTIKSAYGILADKALTEVVKTVLGLPDEMANADIDQQAKAITDRLNIDDLKDPEKLDKLITRFTAAYDATTDAPADPILSLFDTTSNAASLDLDLVMTLNNLKHGGS